MAAGDAYLSCGNPNISIEELLNSILVVNGDGVVGLRTVVIASPAGELDLKLNCGGVPLNMADIFRNAIRLTASGEPAITLMTEA